MPIILLDHGVSLSVITSIMGIFFLGQILGTPIGGILADVVGSKKTGQLALLLELSGCIGYVVSENPWAFLVARFIHGLGYGLGMSPASIFLRKALAALSPKVPNKSIEDGKSWGKTTALACSAIATVACPLIIAQVGHRFMMAIVCLYSLMGVVVIGTLAIGHPSTVRDPSTGKRTFVNLQSMCLALTGVALWLPTQP